MDSLPLRTWCLISVRVKEDFRFLFRVETVNSSKQNPFLFKVTVKHKKGGAGTFFLKVLISSYTPIKYTTDFKTKCFIISLMQKVKTAGLDGPLHRIKNINIMNEITKGRSQLKVLA